MARAGVLVLLIGLLVSCASAPPQPPQPGPGEAVDPSAARMQELLRSGRESLAQGLVSDGIKQLVSVLAERQKLSAAPPAAQQAAAEAETELARLGPALAIEADTAWLDASNNQVTGSTLEFQKLPPSVIVTIRQAGGRSLVSNAPVQFAFVRGGGILSAAVNTNEFGQANCVIARLDNASAEQIVRASLVYRVGSYAWSFGGLERDFVYAPPLQRAALVVLERSELGPSRDPYVADPVFQELKAIRYDFSLYNGALSPQGFQRVYDGDPAALASLGLQGDVSYLVVVLSDCTSVRQLELAGRRYELYISDARATLRLLRKVDGKVMYQASVERAHARGTHGQGGTREKAAEDVLRAISGDLAAAVRRDLPAISAALKGE